MSIKKDLSGRRIAVLIDQGFEQVEMVEPVRALKEAGAEVLVIAPADKIRAWSHTEWGDEFFSDVLLDQAEAFEYDGLLLPGGVMSPDRLRTNLKAVAFVKHFMETGKPIAAICHGPWTLIETKMLQGKTMTSWPSLKTDLINAGVNWVDKEVIADRGIVTSRKPSDIPQFNKKMIEEFMEGIHLERIKSSYEQRSPIKKMARMNENIDTRNWDELDNMRDMTNDF